MSDVIDRDAQGRFLPGNRYMAPRWIPGQSGKPARYTPRKLEHAVKKYVELSMQNGVDLVWAGLAAHLGMTTHGLNGYLRAEIGKSEDDRAGCAYVLDSYRTLMEAQIEMGLGSKEYATAGLIFKAKNMFPDRWQDTKNINIDAKQTKLVVELDPNSKLAQRLQASGGVEVLEATCDVVDITSAPSGECTTVDSD